MAGVRWSVSDRRLLSDLAAEGCGYEQAAYELNRTPRAVKYAADHFGVRFRRGPERNLGKRALILQLLGSGFQVKTAARHMNVSLGWAWRVVKAMCDDGIVKRTGRGRACHYIVVA